MPTTITPIGAAPIVPDSTIDEPVFDVQQEDFYRWEKDELTPKANALALATYSHAVEAGAAAENAIAAAGNAAALTHFAGRWSTLVGELLKGSGVEDQGTFWVLLNDLPNVTLSRPGVTVDWAPLDGYFSPGDLLMTVRALPAPRWVPTNGAVFAKTAYPALAARLPTPIARPTYRLANPVTLPTGSGKEVAFSNDGVYLAVAHTTVPCVTIYKRAGDSFVKLADPAVVPAGGANGVAFSPDGAYLAVAHITAPFLTIYKRAGDAFTKLPDPATLPTGVAYGLAFSADSTYLTVGHSTTPFMTIYKRTAGDVFVKLANPVLLPGTAASDASFSADGTYLAVSHGTTPFVGVYKRVDDTFTKLADLPAAAGGAQSIAFSPDGAYLAVGCGVNSPYLAIYKRAGDVFTKLANPAVVPGGTVNGVAFSPDNKYLALAHIASPFVSVYERNGDAFTKLEDPAALPAGNAYGVAFWKGASNFEYFLAVTVAGTPYVHFYRDAYTFDPATEFAVPALTAPVGDPAKIYIRGG